MGGPTWVEALPLVGREPEQAVLGEAVDRVALGSGTVLLLAGEAGIGKTSLARYGLRLAREREFTVLVGRAQPLDRGLAYAPVVEAFGRHLRASEPVERKRLADGLAVLGRLWEGLDLPATEPLPDPQWEQTRLYEALARLVGRICDQAPVALLLDDAHWADVGTLEVLSYLLRDLPDLPVLLLASRRPEASGPALARFVDVARRTGVAREVSLSRLSRAEVGTMLGRVLAGAAGADVTDLVAERSGGVPLYVEAFGQWVRRHGLVVRRAGAWTLGEQAALGVPPAVRDVILADLARLPAGRRAVVDVAAVAGERGDPRLVAQVAAGYAGGGVDPDAALAALVRAGTLVEELAGDAVWVDFPHPLHREVAYQALPTAQRRRLHALVADELARIGDVVGQAAHVRAAGPEVDPGTAAGVLLAAGRAALDGYSFAEARELYEAAAAAAEAARPELVSDAYLGLGESLRWAHRLGEAAAVWRRALAHPRGPRDPRTRAHLYYLIADGESHRDPAAAGRDVAAGLAELAGCDACDEEILLLFVQLMAARRAVDPDGMHAARERIAQAAPRVATPLARGLAILAGMICQLEQAEYGAVARALAAGAPMEVPQWEQAAAGPGIRAMVASGLGDLPALREANRDLAAIEQELGTYVWGYRGSLHRFVEAFYRGEWDRATEELDPMVADDRLADPRSAAVAAMFRPLVAGYRADFETAQRLLDQARSRLEAGDLPARYGRWLLHVIGALVALERGEPAVARDLIEREGEHATTGMLPPWGLVALAEARALTGRVGPARRVVARLAELGPAGSYPPVMASRLAGLAYAADREPAPAAAALRTAQAGFTELGMPFEAARATVEAGEVLVDTSGRAAGPRDDTGGWPTDALADELAAAYRAAVRLGAARYADRAGRLLRALGAPVPRADPAPGGPLTPRQQEIAALVAKGLSNAAIAERLFVSVRTVTSHLEHIYTRLGISSRAALASYVTGAELGGPQ